MSCAKVPNMRHLLVPDSRPLELPFDVRFSVQDAATGDKWVGIHFETPVNSYVMVIPPAIAYELAKTFPEGLIDAARTAQRTTSPLILPTEGLHRG